MTPQLVRGIQMVLIAMLLFTIVAVYVFRLIRALVDEEVVTFWDIISHWDIFVCVLALLFVLYLGAP